MRANKTALPPLAAVVAMATVLRLLAARGDLWLDEIWSLNFARAVRTPLQIFTAIHHDNNHYLNTLYLWAIPTTQNWLSYRFVSVAAGVASVLLAAAILGRLFAADGKRPLAMILGASIVACSFWMTLYSSEARGYALAVCFAYAALYAAMRFFDKPAWSWAFAVAVFSSLGFLSHLTYLEAFVGLAVWSGYRLWQIDRRGQHWLPRMVALHGLPIVVIAWLYIVDIRGITVDGGPVRPYWQVMVSALSLTLGGPSTGPIAGLVAAACAVGAAAACWLLWRRGSDLWLFFLASIAVAPALMLVAFEPGYLAERYFLLSIACLLLMLAWLVAELWAGPRQSALLGAACVLSLVANLWHVARLIRDGRGGYQPAIQWMAEHSPRREVLVGGDMDFWNGTVIRFYSQFIPSPRITYMPEGTWPRSGPEWVVLSSQSSHFDPPEMLPDAHGHVYRLARIYPSAEISGWTWAVYHNAAAGGS